MNKSTGVAGLQEAVLAKLRTGEWSEGAKLPTERELSMRYNIGRSVVRRVLGQMKEQGLISQTVGSGTYVSKGAATLLQAMGPQGAVISSPAELMEARVIIEPMIATLVVSNATNADFLHMEDCCAHAEAAQSIEQFEYWDGALHQAIADATHNSFIQGVFQLMNQAREQGEWGALKKKSLTAGRRQAYQEEHRALVVALKERDAERARDLTMQHLVHVRRNLFSF